MSRSTAAALLDGRFSFINWLLQGNSSSQTQAATSRCHRLLAILHDAPMTPKSSTAKGGNTKLQPDDVGALSSHARRDGSALCVNTRHVTFYDALYPSRDTPESNRLARAATDPSGAILSSVEEIQSPRPPAVPQR